MARLLFMVSFNVDLIGDAGIGFAPDYFRRVLLIQTLFSEGHRNEIPRPLAK